ncbi:hypothetical protein QT231_10420 [Halomonas sp. SpR1]|uniref:hypothetical protein n=1 Tax=Halomonas sp. SpR1 TaxID=3050462 RepID=UPI0027E508B4|nr:hypothetical protein [Halomonas sp. SpR1]MDQ7733114.1 hypothetical protein [Halomonas sp. SpR1]
MLEYTVSSDIEHVFKNMPEAELNQKLKDLNLPQNRDVVLGKILTGNIQLHIAADLDIKIYALNKLFPNSHDKLKISETIFSKSQFTQYDPAKNGQNMMKHGISFREVVSYSTKFGTLIVPLPEVGDERRVVIFSDLSLDSNKYCLTLPLEGVSKKLKLYTFSVAQQLPFGFRFISSRFISKTKFSKKIKSDLRGVSFESDEQRKLFFDRCIKILRRYLFEKAAVSNYVDYASESSDNPLNPTQHNGLRPP